MLRLTQIIAGSIALLFLVISISFFSDWLGKTDFLMGHTYGPATSLLTATWSAGAGILFSVAWIGVGVLRKCRVMKAGQPKQSGWRLLQGVAIVLLATVGVIIFAIGILEHPHARQQFDVQRLKSGRASVTELVDALESSHHETQFWAIVELRKLGRGAKPAIPVLVEALQDRALRTQAAETLGNLGSEAEAAIPALIEAIKREQGKTSGTGSGGPSTFSWRAGVTLAHIGPASIPELITLLTHQDRYVRMTAANALREIGPRAKDAVPALNEASKDDDEAVHRAASSALDRIDGRRRFADDKPTVPKSFTAQETSLASWTTQPPFRGRNRPPGTVNLRFADGYVWPIKGSVVGWDKRVEGQRRIQAAITATRRFEHVLETNEVRIINSPAPPYVESGRAVPEDRGTADEAKVAP